MVTSMLVLYSADRIPPTKNIDKLTLLLRNVAKHEALRRFLFFDRKDTGHSRLAASKSPLCQKNCECKTSFYNQLIHLVLFNSPNALLISLRSFSCSAWTLSRLYKVAERLDGQTKAVLLVER